MRACPFTTMALSIFLPLGILFAGEEPKLESETDRLSYSLGYQIGNDFKRQEMGFDAEAFINGLNDAGTGAEPAMNLEEINKVLGNIKGKINDVQRKGVRELRAREKKEADEKRMKSQAFLAENAKKPGVKTLPSGLQYKVINPGNGKKPGPHDIVRVHYRGMQINGHEFDSSDRRDAPSSFRVDGVIPGWTEALQMMQVGARWELYIPPNLAYGERGPLADETLIYEIELVGIGENGEASE